MTKHDPDLVALNNTIKILCRSIDGIKEAIKEASKNLAIIGEVLQAKPGTPSYIGVGEEKEGWRKIDIENCTCLWNHRYMAPGFPVDAVPRHDHPSCPLRQGTATDGS